MLISVHRRLRRQHRRVLLFALAVLAVAMVAVTAHTAAMNGGIDDGAMGDVAALCLAVGGSLAVVGTAVVAARRLHRRTLWILRAPLAAPRPFIAVASGFLVRAGPPARPLLQVFRL